MFVQNEISSRFIQTLRYLKENKIVPSIRQFALSIDIHPQCISDIMTGKRDVNSDIIYKSVISYNLNLNFLYKGEGSFLSIADQINQEVFSLQSEEGTLNPISYISSHEHHSYCQQFDNQEFVKNLPSFSLPDRKYEKGHYRCFDVQGDSMEPTFFSGDKLICQFLEADSWESRIKNNFVYVLLTNSGIVVKRVINNLKLDQTLSILSDNNFYARKELSRNEIREVWLVSTKISPFLPAPNNIRNGIHAEVDNLKDTIVNQSKMIESLNSTIEKLLKQNRMTRV